VGPTNSPLGSRAGAGSDGGEILGGKVSGDQVMAKAGKDLDGQVAIVTGGAGGIGGATARLLAEQASANVRRRTPPRHRCST
jgi:hypothetical protein